MMEIWAAAAVHSLPVGLAEPHLWVKEQHPYDGPFSPTVQQPPQVRQCTCQVDMLESLQDKHRVNGDYKMRFSR